jgi:hypothetical protein
MRNIFEQPWLLLIVSAVALLVVFVFRALFPERRNWWLWLLPILLAASAFALDYFIETDAEKVRAVLARAVKAVEKEDAELLTPLFSKDYRDSFHASKEALLSNCKTWLSQPIIEKNVLRIVSLEVNPPNAEAVFTVRVVFDPQGPVFEYRKMMLFKLRADFRKQRSDWLFSRVEVLEIDLHPADWQHIQGGAGEIF